VNGWNRFSNWSSELVVGADRQVGVPGTDADQRDAQFVAQEPQQVQKLPAGVAATSQDIVQFVDHQDANSGRSKQAQRELLLLGHSLPGPQRCAARGEQRGVEPAHRRL
jgi:hypothetical protein